MSKSGSQFYLSSDQQDLLVAALSSNQTNGTRNGPRNARASDSPQQVVVNGLPNGIAGSALYDSPIQSVPGSGQLDFNPDDSPYLDFDLDADADGNFDYDSQDMIGDLPGANGSDEGTEQHEKRKSIDSNEDEDEGGGKRRESDDKTAKKPGRKPLTSEPTSKRKAQNRAAQRAFRERKEKHLKDLETKVDDLEKASESTSHENGLLRAQVGRLQVELKEYRKRLSWVSGSGSGLGRSPPVGSSAPGTAARGTSGSDFQFEFPKFGDLPGAHFFNNGTIAKQGGTKKASTGDSATPATHSLPPGVVGRKSLTSSSPKTKAPTNGSTSTSPAANSLASPTGAVTSKNNHSSSMDSLSGLFSPSILEASRAASVTDYMSHPGSSTTANQSSRGSTENINNPGIPAQLYSHPSMSNTDSPSASSESQHGQSSSMGTSPEPSLNSPSTKLGDIGLNTINEENLAQSAFGGETTFCEKLKLACGDSQNPVPAMMIVSNGNVNPLGPARTQSDFNWLAEQNGGSFDPVLFGEYRDPQDAVVGQDFGTFFNDAFPLPDLGSPFNTFNNDVLSVPSPAPKMDLMKQVNAAQAANDEEVVPGEDPSKMLTCNKIWDRLQSMEKFRNGEIDIDNLCSELRTKARCSEGGAVVNQKDVEQILNRAQ